jgi:molybdenum cofactor cytidylyltransferase
MLNTKILKAISTSFYKTGKLVASAYDGAIGIPALFPRSYFADLLNLEGKEGARKILRKSGATIEKVDFPGGGVDIDTEDDWNKFLQAGGESTMS